MELEEFLQKKVEAAPVEYKCKGLVFKGYYSIFKTQNGFEQRQGLRFLKRKSCPGCINCGWIKNEEFDEAIVMNRVLMQNDIENGKLYTLKISNLTVDRETGIADDWDLEVVEYK